jgi:hypothetical protein
VNSREWLSENNLVLIDPDPIGDGREKIVWRVSDGIDEKVAKIYRYQQIGDPIRINRQRASTAEFNAYKIFRNTDLLPYIPMPNRLLYEHKLPIGLHVELKDGEPMDDSTLVPPYLFDGLARALLTLPPHTRPDMKDFGDTTLGFTGYSLWFAECKIKHYPPDNEYRMTVIDNINALKQRHSQI